MNWYPQLYTGPTAVKRKKKIMRQLDNGKLVLGVYAVTLASNRKDLLDIYPSFMLLKPQNQARQILGLAVTKEEALEVCKDILTDVFEKTGGYDVRSFFA